MTKSLFSLFALAALGGLMLTGCGQKTVTPSLIPTTTATALIPTSTPTPTPPVLKFSTSTSSIVLDSKGTIEVKKFDYPFTDQTKSGCDVHLMLPVYKHKTLDPKIVTSINQSLRLGLMGRADVNDQDTFKKMISDCEQSLKSEQGIPGIYTDDLQFTVTYHDKDKLSVRGNRYTYMGGAHGISILTGVIIDLNKGTLIGLKELLKPDAKVSYVTLEKTNLLKQAGADLFDEPKKLFEDFVKNPPQQLSADQEKNANLFNPNVYLNDKGLVTVYNPYDIGPYVIGSIEVLVPWNQIKPLLK